MNLCRLLFFVTLAVHVSSTNIPPPPAAHIPDRYKALDTPIETSDGHGPIQPVLGGPSKPSRLPPHPAPSESQPEVHRAGTPSELQVPAAAHLTNGRLTSEEPGTSEGARNRHSTDALLPFAQSSAMEAGNAHSPDLVFRNRCYTFAERHPEVLAVCGYLVLASMMFALQEVITMNQDTSNKRRSLVESGKPVEGTEEIGAWKPVGPCDCHDAKAYFDADGKHDLDPSVKHTKRQVSKSFYQLRIPNDDGMETEVKELV
ncbi:hypothetical protein EV360DRAFT_87196 [Lentinula raphanica]|nr:hypothetical protein EV360DRAFT_87196 [Lentinula raphanica]